MKQSSGQSAAVAGILISLSVFVAACNPYSARKACQKKCAAVGGGVGRQRRQSSCHSRQSSGSSMRVAVIAIVLAAGVLAYEGDDGDWVKCEGDQLVSHAYNDDLSDGKEDGLENTLGTYSGCPFLQLYLPLAVSESSVGAMRAALLCSLGSRPRSSVIMPEQCLQPNISVATSHSHSHSCSNQTALTKHAKIKTATASGFISHAMHRSPGTTRHVIGSKRSFPFSCRFSTSQTQSTRVSSSCS